MKYEIPYEQINSQKHMDKLVPDEWVAHEVNNPFILKNKFKRYILKDILREYASTTLDDPKVMSVVEDYVNVFLSHQLDGEPIPDHGFVLNTNTKVWESGQQHQITGRIFDRVFTPITFNIGFNFPNDHIDESCLREIIGMDEHHTTFFQIPFRLLSSKVNNQFKKPVRGNHWVYRIRFIIKDEDKYKQSLNQYYRGYIGATSQNNVIYRFFQHFRCYNSDAPNEVYRAWRELRDCNIEHIIIIEVLERCSTHEEAFACEAELIKSEGTLMPNGLNMTAGGEEGIAQCKACGIKSANLEDKDDQFASYLNSGTSKQDDHKQRKFHYVRSHLRQYKPHLYTTVRGHWRNYTDEIRDILIRNGVCASDLSHSE